MYTQRELMGREAERDRRQVDPKIGGSSRREDFAGADAAP